MRHTQARAKRREPRPRSCRTNRNERHNRNTRLRWGGMVANTRRDRVTAPRKSQSKHSRHSLPASHWARARSRLFLKRDRPKSHARPPKAWNLGADHASSPGPKKAAQNIGKARQVAEQPLSALTPRYHVLLPKLKARIWATPHGRATVNSRALRITRLPYLAESQNCN